MEEVIKKWLQRAKYDLDTAEAMFKMRRYLYVAFMCQQALEKILKAMAIKNNKELLRSHNLVRLAEIAEVYNLMPLEYQDFLAIITPFAIEARYGDYRKRLSEIINRRMAEKYLIQTKEVFKWLKKLIRKK
jgi:HEPN domain-containing protein